MNNENNNSEPYKASGNMNTYISNPSANFNDMMNVNIQDTTTSTSTNNTPMPNTPPANNIPVQNTTAPIPNEVPNQSIPNNTNNQDTNNGINKVYVSSDNKPKKKTISLNFGPEFKIAFLIVVILLIFILLLPYLEDLITKR